MYETNFGFKDRPFTVSPSPACFFQAAEHQNVLDELLVSISSLNGITILTGEAGTGKTAICRQVISRLEDQFQVQFVEHCNFPTVRALLQTLLYSLTDCYEKVSEQELRLALSAELRSSYLTHSQPLLLIVDEAHLLPATFLEELRVLSDIAFDGKPALQLMLSGQPVLEETLIQPAMSSLNQRVGCQVYLDKMTRQESQEYINYRIKRVATEDREYFTEDAVKFITQVSDGLPRCLNQICDHSLMLAFLQDSLVVDEEITREAFKDLQQLPLHWNDPLPVRSPLDEIRGTETTEEWETAGSEVETFDYQVNASVEDQLNELVDLASDANELAEIDEAIESEVDEFDWDSAELLSLGEEIEAIEVGSDLDESAALETSATETEPVQETFTTETPRMEIEEESLAAVVEPVGSLEITAEFVPIVDRYAAIDAGLDPEFFSEETEFHADVMSSPLRLQPPQFRTAEPPASIESTESVAPAAESFAETQLPDLKPNVFQELAKEISDDDGTFERMLAEQVYEVCSETRRGLVNALNEIRNYTEPADETPQVEEAFTYDMVEPEDEPKPEPTAGTTFRLDPQPVAQEQNSATAHLKGPAFKRYKNLFTRLRRKQDAS